MVFGFFGGGKKPSKGDSSKKSRDEPEDADDDEEEEIERVIFQGAINGKSADLQANARLTKAGLLPAKDLVTDALTRRAETVRMDFKADRAQTTLYIDGMPYAGKKMPRANGLAILQMLKLLAGLDPKEKNAQAGGMKSEYLGVPWEVLVETIPAPEGQERLNVRLRNMKAKMDTPEEIGFSPTMKPTIREHAGNRRGIILVTGPSGSGVTTSTYGVIRSVDVYLHSIFSVADLGARDLFNITKFETLEGDDLKTTAERAMRSEADILFIDPIKTPEIAKQVVTFADRVTVIAECPAKDSSHCIKQFCDLVGDPPKVAELLCMVVSQKLIRTLCPNCKEAFRPNPKLLAKVGLPPEVKVLYRKPPEPAEGESSAEFCSKCENIGYMGRTAMYEMLVVTDAMRELIAKGAPPDQLKAQARVEGMLSLNKDGLRLVADGKTSLEELQRVFQG